MSKGKSIDFCFTEYSTVLTGSVFIFPSTFKYALTEVPHTGLKSNNNVLPQLFYRI